MTGAAVDTALYAASLLPGVQNNVAALDDPPVYTLDVRLDWDALAVAGTEMPFLIEGFPGGMEFPGLVFIGTDFYDPDGFFAKDPDVIVAHETAHQ